MLCISVEGGVTQIKTYVRLGGVVKSVRERTKGGSDYFERTYFLDDPQG